MMRPFVRPGFVFSAVVLTSTAFCGGAAGALEVQHLVAAAGIREVAVSSHADGSSTVAWILEEPDLDHLLYVQRFDAEGAPSTPPALVYESLLPASELLVVTDSAGNDLVAYKVYIGLSNAIDQFVGSAYSSSGTYLCGAGLAPISGIYRGFSSNLKVAPAPGGGWLSSWTQVGYEFEFPTARALRVDPVSCAGAISDISDPASDRDVSGFSLAGNATSMLATWTEMTHDGPGDADTYEVVGRLLDAQGAPTSPIHPLGIAGVGAKAIYDLTSWGFGLDRFFLAWNSQPAPASPRTIGGVELIGDVPVGPAFAIRTGATTATASSPLALAVDSNGRAILGWNEPDSDATGSPASSFLYRFRSSGAALSAVEELSALPGYRPGALPRVGTSPDGHWIAAWPRVADGEAPAGVDAVLEPSVSGCAAETHALCLTGNRFRVTATYHDHLGRDGVGYAAPLTSESGTFWFFSPESVELIVKVVDACSHPDFHNFWVFASGLTDVQVRLEVVDTWTGATWERDTSLGEPFPPALDTAAFDTCSATPFRVTP